MIWGENPLFSETPIYKLWIHEFVQISLIHTVTSPNLYFWAKLYTRKNHSPRMAKHSPPTYAPRNARSWNDSRRLHVQVSVRSCTAGTDELGSMLWRTGTGVDNIWVSTDPNRIHEYCYIYLTFSIFKSTKTCS